MGEKQQGQHLSLATPDPPAVGADQSPTTPGQRKAKMVSLLCGLKRSRREEPLTSMEN